MSCFSLAFLEQLLIWAVIIIAIYSILNLVVPWILAKLQVDGGIILAVLRILLWAVVAIVVIIFCFAVIGCLIQMGGGLHLPALR